jgi:adhesin HecA-like repeat protein
MNRFDRLLIGTCAVLVGSTLLLAAGTPAYAGQQGGGFREFRMQNEGLDRHAARRMFNADRKIDRVIESRRLPVATGDIQGASRTEMLRADRQFARANNLETRINHLTGRSQSFQANDRGALVRLSSGVNLDLTSGNQNIVLGNNLFSDSVSSIVINVGGETKTLTAGSRVTASEYVAAKQVLNGESQSVVIGRSGAASGGSIDLGALTQENDVMRASNLVVSSNVTTTGDFGRRSDFRLTGDLVNYGTVNALSSDRNIRSGAIHADDITNHSGALINSTVDLTLDAAGDLTNNGTIVSTQALTLTAGGSISNTGSVRGNDSVNLQSSSINNSGLIKSTNGNVNLDGPATTLLAVNNSNGTLAALNGAINLRNTAYDGGSGSTITGGDLLSRELNLHSGQGLVEVSVNDLTGIVNETGAAAHVSASTDVLTIGSVCLTGDPTFYNQGNINVNNDISAPEDLVIVASGDITVDAGKTIQAGDNSKGYNITMIAGADFTADPSKNSPTLPGGTTGGVSLSGKASKTGGGIQLGSNAVVKAQSTDSIGSDSGGNITLIAFGGKTPLAGKVLLSSASLLTGGIPGGENGDVTIVAGAKTAGNAVEVGVIDTTGGLNSSVGGAVNIVTATPISATRNTPTVFDAAGKLVSGGLIASTKVNKGAGIYVNNNSSGLEIRAVRDITFSSGGNTLIEGQLESIAGNALLRSGGTITGTLSSNVKAVEVRLEAASNIGTDAQKFRVEANNVVINQDKTSKGTSSQVQILGFGSKVVHAEKALGTVNIDGSKANISLFANSLKSVEVVAQQIQFSLLSSKTIDSVALSTLDPNFDLSGVTLDKVETIVLSSARDVGSSIDPNNFLSGIKSLTISAGRDAYNNINDSKTVADVIATRDIAIGTVGNVIENAISSTGSVNISSIGGTLTFTETVSASTAVNIINAGTKTSSKITFAANAIVFGDNLTIKVGPTTAMPMPTVIANVLRQEVSGGTILLTGAGIKANAPLNSISSNGAGRSIEINNGFKSGNLTFGGNVNLVAN